MGAPSRRKDVVSAIVHRPGPWITICSEDRLSRPDHAAAMSIGCPRHPNKRGERATASAPVDIMSDQLFLTRKVSWQPPHSLPIAGAVALRLSRSLILALASVTTLAKLSILALKPAWSSQIFGDGP